MNIVAQSESDLFVKRLATILMDFLSHFITDKGVYYEILISIKT